MDEEMEEQDDGLYDALPEIPPALNQDTTVSSPVVEGNFASSSSSSDDVVQRRASNEDCQWVWEANSQCRFVNLLNDNIEVKFHSHSHISRGTAVVRSTEPMSDNQYFWEVEMNYPVQGTDIMIGVGTSKAKVKDFENRFTSALGMDSESWGFSYTGLFHHNKQRHWYTENFGFCRGCIVGVHLDLWKGTLSFFKDRRYLGVASSNLKGKTLYAMASSTIAGSSMKLIRSCSFPSSLQFLCCAKLREAVPDDKDVLDVIRVPPGLKHYLQNRLGWLLCSRCPEDDLQCCSSNKTVKDGDHAANKLSRANPFNNSHSIGNQCFMIMSALMGNFDVQELLHRFHTQEEAGSAESPAKQRRLS